jgi:hypothetical protein
MYLVIFVIFVHLHTKAISQSLLPDASSSPAVKNAINFYSTSLTEQLRLYNGKEYQDYPLPFDEGHPYFIKTDWSKGTVDYDGNTYGDVSILYNTVTDEVIILASNKVLKIQLIKEKVEGFSLSGHSFLNLSRDSLLSADMTAGFYDVLTKDKISLLARRTKNIQTYATHKLELKVFKKDHFYLKKNNAYFPIHTKKSLLKQLSDKKKEIQQYIKQNKLRFRKDPENVMVKITEYYNQLTK